MPEVPPEVAKMTLDKILPWVAAGVGVSALENKYVAEKLPPELKNINYGIGAVTGVLAADPKTRPMALGGLAAKQLGLFGIGGLDEFRRSQQALVDTNLQTATINRDTAMTERDAVGSKAKMLAAFLLPALAGAGALSYYAYNQRKKQRAGTGYKTVGQRGATNGMRKVRLDIPTSALPEGFFSSLVNADDKPGARMRIMEKAAFQRETLGDALHNSLFGRLERQVEQTPHNIWSSAPVQKARTVADLLYDFTGIPSVGRANKDLALGAGHYLGGDGGVAARYGLAGLGGAMMAIPALKWGALPLLARFGFGRARLARQVANSGMFRGFSGKLLNTLPGTAVTPAELKLLQNPATRETAYRSLVEAGQKGTRGVAGTRNIRDAYLDSRHAYKYRPFVNNGPTPSTLLGEAALAGRRLSHGATELGRRGVSFVRRNPNMSLTLGGTPLTFLGSARDDDKFREFMADRESSLPKPPFYGPHRLPMSSQLAGMLANAGSAGQPAIASQLRGSPQDPYALGGYR